MKFDSSWIDNYMIRNEQRIRQYSIYDPEEFKKKYQGLINLSYDYIYGKESENYGNRQRRNCRWANGHNAVYEMSAEYLRVKRKLKACNPYEIDKSHSGILADQTESIEDFFANILMTHEDIYNQNRLIPILRKNKFIRLRKMRKLNEKNT